MFSCIISIGDHPSGDTSVEIARPDGTKMIFDDVADAAFVRFIRKAVEESGKSCIEETINFVECHTYTF